MLGVIFSLPFLLAYLAVSFVSAPRIIRSLDRGVLPQCPEGATLKFCNTYHSKTCRFENGLQRNPTVEAMWTGIAFSLVWPFTFTYLLIQKQVAAPDEVALEQQKKYDATMLKKLEAHQERLREIEDAKLARELEAAEKDREKGIEVAEIVEDDPPEPDLREDSAKFDRSDFIDMRQYEQVNANNQRWDEDLQTWVPGRTY